MILSVVLSAPFEQSYPQEFELIEGDDFVNPRELHSGSMGKPMENFSFFASRASTGIDHNYQFRNEYTKATLGFLRVANSYYYDLFGQPFQTSLKVAGLVNDGTRNMPSFKVRLQHAIYVTHTSQSYGEQATRFRVSLDVEKRGTHRPTHEYSLGMDVGMQLPLSELFVVGGVIYVWRPDAQKHFIAASALVPVVYWKNGSNVKLGLGGTFEGGNFLEATRETFKTINGEIAVEFVIPATFNVIHLAYLPSYRFDGKEWNHEIGAFLDVPLFSRLF